MSDDASSTKKKEEPFASIVGTFFFQREALLIGLMTASIYLCTYFFTRSYLGYFGLTPEFIEIELGDVLIFGSVIITFSYLAFQVLSLLPIIAIVPTIKLFIVLSPAIVLINWTCSLFSSSGFTWLSISSLFATMLLICINSLRLVDVLRGRKTLSAWLESEFEAEIEVRKKFVSHHLIGGAGGFSLFVYICLLMAPMGSHLSGLLYASSRVNFTFIDMAGEQYVVVSDLSDGFVLAGLSQKVPSGTFYLNGNTNWLSLDSVSQAKVTIQSFPEGLGLQVKQRTWTTFWVFWERNFGGAISDRP